MLPSPVNKTRCIDSEAESENEGTSPEPERPNIANKIEDHKARLAAKGIVYMYILKCMLLNVCLIYLIPLCDKAPLKATPKE